ncbi:MAG: CHASE3 domain-containing protein [Reyranella sp.]|uniref:CHASE3 domain-containing protein n=1 Tax=Reyranella sp. TaxID=1929291 RepID=UPI003D0A76BB
MTNNDRSLGHYNAALAQLTSDNPTQQAKIPRLRQLVCAKLAEFNDTIELRQTQGFDAALAVVISGRGKAAMDAIRAQV